MKNVITKTPILEAMANRNELYNILLQGGRDIITQIVTLINGDLRTKVSLELEIGHSPYSLRIKQPFIEVLLRVEFDLPASGEKHPKGELCLYEIIEEKNAITKEIDTVLRPLKFVNIDGVDTHIHQYYNDDGDSHPIRIITNSSDHMPYNIVEANERNGKKHKSFEMDNLQFPGYFIRTLGEFLDTQKPRIIPSKDEIPDIKN